MAYLTDEEWALDQRRADVFERYRAKLNDSVHLLSHATEEWPAIFDMMERAMQVGVPLTDGEVFEAVKKARDASVVRDIADIIAEEIGEPDVEIRREARKSMEEANPNLSEEVLDRAYGEGSR